MVSKFETVPEWLQEGLERSEGTLWQVIKAYRANLRQGTVGVKTRAMVASTGKKPYKQKKTGNARRGSFVSPLHVGGGVAHGPKARDYRQMIPTKMGRLALKIALARRVQSGSVFVGSVEVASGKTKDAVSQIREGLSPIGRTVVCLGAPSVETLRALKNVKGVELVSPQNLTCWDILRARRLVADADALTHIQNRLG